MKELISALEEGTMHNPSKKYPRLIVVISIAPNESHYPTHHHPDLYREMLVVNFLSHF